MGWSGAARCSHGHVEEPGVHELMVILSRNDLILFVHSLSINEAIEVVSWFILNNIINMRLSQTLSIIIHYC